MPGSCGAPGSTKVPPTPPGHLWVPFEPGAMAQPGEGWGQRWEHSRMAWGGCVPLGGGACGEAGIDAPPLLPLGISVQFMGGGTARSKQNQNVFLGCSFTPWFTSGGSWGGGGPVGHSPKPPTPKGAGAAEGAARVTSPHSTVDTQGDANHIVVSCPTTGPPPAPAMGAPPCSPPLPLLQQEWGAAPCASNKLGGGGLSSTWDLWLHGRGEK